MLGVACLLFGLWWPRSWREKVLVRVAVVVAVATAGGAAVVAAMVAQQLATSAASGSSGVAAAVVAVLVVVLAVVGGGPVTVGVMDVISGYQRRQGDKVVLVARASDVVREAGAPWPGLPPRGGTGRDDDGGVGLQDVLPAGAWLGVFERLSVCVSLLCAWPEGIIVVVGLKGVGRYQELAARRGEMLVVERFLIGTFCSVLWASAAAGVGVLLR